MIQIPEITSLPRGARFFRADLHIHSVVGSHDVKNQTATPEAIVATAVKEGLKIIAITDHNEITGVAAALAATNPANILIVPGVELSTLQGHLLCYLPDYESLQRFYAQLTIVDHGTQNSRCQNSMFECLEKLYTFGGFGVLAHVDAPGGLEIVIPGASPHKVDILCHRALLGIELKNASSLISYANHDSDPERVRIGKQRIQLLGLGIHQCLARLLNSDAHTVEALGRNASGDRKVTRYKMNSLTFGSLRIALEDSMARVRIEDEIPTVVPLVRGIRLSGGFLDEQCIHFSSNLNCIIGGRGTGKSTTFEALRCLTGQPGGTTVVDSDVWPDQVDLLIEDQSSQMHCLARARNGEVENINDPSEGPVDFAVECYGQGETQKISQRAQNDPSALLEYFDRFVDVRQQLNREQELSEELLTLQTKIEKATEQVELIPQYERSLSIVQSQLQTLEKANVKDIIILQRRIENERQIRQSIMMTLKEFERGISQQDIRNSINAMKTAADPKNLVVGSTEFLAIAEQASVFENVFNSVETTVKTNASKLLSIVNSQLTTWRMKEFNTLQQIEEKKREIEAQGMRVDMAYIQKLTNDEARHGQSVKNLKMWNPHLDDLRKQRKALLNERWAVRSQIAMRRKVFALKANKALRTALSDYRVTLKFEENGYSPDACEIIAEVMGWRTQQVSRASTLAEKLTLPKLLEVIARKDVKSIQELKSEDGVNPLFSRAEAISIIERLSPSSVYFRLERAPVSDRPSLTVTKVITDESGKKRPFTREFRQLSLGQQQSVLLALMLSAENNIPLFIDQPEDNLDGEFIYQTVIPVLRRAKERRQVIIVTHNANIAVLGDAEQIIILRATNEKGRIVSRGSIDEPEIRKEACALLEGSQEAFQRRSRIYGVPETR